MNVSVTLAGQEACVMSAYLQLAVVSSYVYPNVWGTYSLQDQLNYSVEGFCN